MIKSKKGEVTIKGSKADIEADMACLVRGLIDGDVMTPDEIKHCVDAGLMDDKEREDAIKKAISNLFAEFFKEDK